MESTVVKRRNKNEKCVQSGIVDCEKLMNGNIIIFERPCKLELQEQTLITLTTTIKKERCQEQEVEPPGQRPT